MWEPRNTYALLRVGLSRRCHRCRFPRFHFSPGLAADNAKLLFIIFLVLFVISLFPKFKKKQS